MQGPDPLRRFHLEADASLNPHVRKGVEGVSLKRAGGGFVLRSPSMKVVGKYTVSLGFLSSPTLAEALVLLRGMRVARQRHGVKVLRARTDCFCPGRARQRPEAEAHDPALRTVIEQICGRAGPARRVRAQVVPIFSRPRARGWSPDR